MIAGGRYVSFIASSVIVTIPIFRLPAFLSHETTFLNPFFYCSIYFFVIVIWYFLWSTRGYQSVYPQPSEVHYNIITISGRFVLSTIKKKKTEKYYRPEKWNRIDSHRLEKAPSCCSEIADIAEFYHFKIVRVQTLKCTMMQVLSTNDRNIFNETSKKRYELK